MTEFEKRNYKEIAANITNIKEAKKLAYRYKRITINQLQKKNRVRPYDALTDITGFGSLDSCTLCKACFRGDNARYINCHICIYAINSNCTQACFRGDNAKTYDAIDHAYTYERLIVAIRDRSDHIRKVIKEIEKWK